MFLLLVFAVLMGAVFYRIDGPPPRAQREILFTIGLILIVGAVVAQKVEFSAGILIFFCGLSLLYHFNPYTVKAGEKILVFGLFYAGVVVALKQGWLRAPQIYDLIVAVALVNVAWVVLQHYGIFWLLGPKPGCKTLNVGLTSNPNELSSLLAICLPAFFRRRRWQMIPLVGVGLYLAQSAVGIVTATFIGLVYMGRKLVEITA